MIPIDARLHRFSRSSGDVRQSRVRGGHTSGVGIKATERRTCPIVVHVTNIKHSDEKDQLNVISYGSARNA